MGILTPGLGLRAWQYGTRVEKSTGTLAATTIPLFTVSGLVSVSNLIGRVTAPVTVPNAYSIKHNPTIGADIVLASATDIGTVDTPTGEIIVVTGVGALVLGGRVGAVSPIILPAGQIESVSVGTDGVILWSLAYIPLDDGAKVTAA